ncbi:PREDICTED: uncharacterized protein LOC108565002 [Nicrophorus vespilloides]|uniref:Uncharacterized protein LOC108565002 n=1 Tax=Nicrophorus vespilloides TaxID=110193 RepID=A0ABM1MYR2_NICVS|nr:PREDICTED: uncharacterized protein LOC108565002 [Nicrophorus vespilloides]
MNFDSRLRVMFSHCAILNQKILDLACLQNTEISRAHCTYVSQTTIPRNIYKLPAEGGRRRRVKLDLQGDFGQISNISLIDNLGDALKVLDQNSSTAETFEIETIKEQQFDFDEKSVPEQALYVKVDGKDLQGNDFVRLSYLNSNIQPKHPIEIEIDSKTDLLLRPNQNVKIYFEVTNNQNYVVYVNFKCEDNKRLLRWMEPLSTWMQPRQTKVVAVTIFTRNDFGSSYQDFVTFYAMTGQEKYIKKILLNVDAKHVVDTRKPTIWHKFTSNCLNVLLANCEDATWSVEITAQDKESGLMLLTPNIHFPNGFTTGTTEEVTGYYSASCCESQLQLTATDRSNNKRTYIIDAYKATLGPWAIAAIVFGVLLIIALIVGIILAIVCRRKQKVSVDLPTTSYRGPINSASTNRY